MDDTWPEFVKTRLRMHQAAIDLHYSVTGYRPDDIRPILYRKAWYQQVLKQELQTPWNVAVDSELKPDRTALTKRVQGAVQNQAEEAARRTTIRAVDEDNLETDRDDDLPEDDPYRWGYARMAQGEYTCAFCMMLVSRGPVYSEGEYLAYKSHPKLYQDKFHERCDCILVPVDRINIEDWDGYRDWQKYEKAWGRVTKGYGGRDAIRKWQNHFREAARKKVDPATMSPSAAKRPKAA